MYSSLKIVVFITTLVITVSHGAVKAAFIQPCGTGSTKSDQTLRVNGSDVALHSSPNIKSEKVISQKATQILKSTQYLTIGNTDTVIEECTQASWSKVRVTEPDSLGDYHIGWVASSSLRDQKIGGDGKVEFTEVDFIWNKKTSPYKKIIVAGVNKVYRENSRCKKISPSLTNISSSRGSKSDPVFFVLCENGSDVFNAFFSKSEVEKGTILSASEYIDRGQAIDLCESYAKSKTNNPSTFSFSRVIDLTISESPSNRRTSVKSSFTAKNSFNLELKHNIRCLFDSSGLIEANISEAK